MKVHLVWVLLVCSTVGAEAPVIVEEVNGRTGKIYVPHGVEIKPGEALYKQPPKFQPEKQVEAKAVETKVELLVPPMKALRQRRHNISADVSVTDTVFDITGIANFNSKSKSQEFDVSYSMNYGYFQPGFELAYSKSTSDESTDVSRVSGFNLRGNFIENLPGNDFVPFAAVGAGYYVADYSAKDGSYDNMASGEFLFFQVGATWYPFGELFGFELSYGLVKAKLKYSGTPEADLKLDARIHGLSLSYVLSF